MCGIAGVLSRRSVSVTLLTGMLDLMAHRGPDGEGEWRGALPGDGEIWLGHRRLSVLDLSDAASLANARWGWRRRVGVQRGDLQLS